MAKHNLEQHVKDATLKAMQEAEQGWQKAMDKIAESASLTKGPIRGGNSFLGERVLKIISCRPRR